MRKSILFLIVVAFFSTKSFSQSSEIKPNQGISVPQFTTVFINSMTTQPKGTVVFDSDLNVMKYYDGTTWQNMSGGGSGVGWAANGNNISNTNLGNVGIGTVSPMTNFHVEGTSIIASNINIDPDTYPDKVVTGRIADGTGWESIGIGGKNSLAGQAWAIGSVNGDVSIAAGDGTNDNSLQTGLILDTHRNLLLTPFGGNVGVGSNNPTNKFEVNGNSYFSGNVGIGTTNPSNKLEVYGTSYLSGVSVLSGSTNISAIVSNAADDGAIKIYSPNGFAGSKYITIDKESIQARRSSNAFPSTLSEQNLKLNPFGGYVGINTGTNTISSNLLVFKSASTNDGSAVFKGTTHYTHFHYGINEDTYIRGGKNGSHVIINDTPLGNVGIGVYPSTYKLEVNGTARTKEVIVETGWADYVFEDDYKLRSIEEMEAFVKENKHLPNIPKASEIEKGGLKVGETNKAMMEKIEELALYIIQLKKEIEVLKSKN